MSPTATTNFKGELKKVVVIRGGTGERIDLGYPGRPGTWKRRLHNFRAWRYRRRCIREGRGI